MESKGTREMHKLTAEDRLRRRREELGLSRRELATLAMVPESQIWAAEHTGERVNPDTHVRLIQALNRRLNTVRELVPIS